MVGYNQQHQCLILLPGPPSEISLNDLRVAYGPSLTRVLRDLAQVSAKLSAKDTIVSLDIAVADNGLWHPDYAKLQKIFGLMYRLTCMIMTENSIDVQFDNDVDTRIMLFHCTENRLSDNGASRADRGFISLATLANNYRSWITVYSVESEVGEGLLQDFLHPRESSMPSSPPKYAIIRVPGGLTMHLSNERNLLKLQIGSSWSSHHSVAVGGTFDHLHAGHKLLLTMTALVLDPIDESDTSGERYLTIGITGDDLLKNKKYHEELETWQERQGSIQRFLLDFLSFLSSRNVLETSEVVANPSVRGREINDKLRSGLQIKYKEIFDPFGPTTSDAKITALVISGETRAGGKAVNDKRAEKEWNLLEIFEVDVLDTLEGTEDQKKDAFASKISSTEIRSRIKPKKEIGGVNSQRGGGEAD